MVEAAMAGEQGRRPRRGQRVVVIVVAVALTLIVGAILATAFLQRTWWYEAYS